jgi:hypothetical protein
MNQRLLVLLAFFGTLFIACNASPQQQITKVNTTTGDNSSNKLYSSAIPGPVTVAPVASWTKGPGINMQQLTFSDGRIYQSISTTSPTYLNTPVDNIAYGQMYRYTVEMFGQGNIELFWQQRSGNFTQYAKKTVALGSIPQIIRFDTIIPSTGTPAQVGIGDIGPGEVVKVFNISVKIDPVANNNAHVTGSWGPDIPWPIVPIHASLLPDGRLLTYGSTLDGKQGNQLGILYYDAWNPSTGVNKTLPQSTKTDIFCSAMALLPTTGSILIAGGDGRLSRPVGLPPANTPEPPNGNTGIKNTNLFNFQDDTKLTESFMMNRPRWYATLTGLPSGQLFVQGGNDDASFDGTRRGVNTNEIYTAETGWTSLKKSSGSAKWDYPRNFVAPNGNIVGMSASTEIYQIDLSKEGKTTGADLLPSQTAWSLPATMYQRGKILIVRESGGISLIDVNSTSPVVTNGAQLPVTSPGIANNRIWSNATVLADGSVLVSGGSGVDNQLSSIGYEALIWNPKTNTWIVGAKAKQPRLYHSTALLLPDGSVFTGGGGLSGPITQKNAEIYYPPYLFNKDGTGTFAKRPVITGAPNEVQPSTPFGLTLDSGTAIQGVNLVRLGSVTHSFDMDQRFLKLPFVQSGANLTVNISETVNTLLPGYYMLFVVNSDGVPSVSKIVKAPAKSPNISIPIYQDTLIADEELQVEGTLKSQNGRYMLRLQADGNLVLTDLSNGSPIWNTLTYGNPNIKRAKLNLNGSFRLQSSDLKTTYWVSKLPNKPISQEDVARLVLENDGRLVLYSIRDGTIWTNAIGGGPLN